jgi:hypothetical protein
MKSLDFQLTKDQMERLDSISKESVNQIFPHSMIGTNYNNNPWLYFGAEKYIIE